MKKTNNPKPNKLPQTIRCSEGGAEAGRAEGLSGSQRSPECPPPCPTVRSLWAPLQGPPMWFSFPAGRREPRRKVGRGPGRGRSGQVWLKAGGWTLSFALTSGPSPRVPRGLSLPPVVSFLPLGSMSAPRTPWEKAPEPQGPITQLCQVFRFRPSSQGLAGNTPLSSGVLQGPHGELNKGALLKARAGLREPMSKGAEWAGVSELMFAGTGCMEWRPAGAEPRRKGCSSLGGTAGRELSCRPLPCPPPTAPTTVLHSIPGSSQEAEGGRVAPTKGSFLGTE